MAKMKDVVEQASEGALGVSSKKNLNLQYCPKPYPLFFQPLIFIKSP
ncbi:hypothetical protein DJ39_3339 [Yersinia ruckeri ATCC 29473]|nr:hypothetical protein DJ39_3339 [Yersinia ruckeri ATCC 29473]QTD78519.1 Uncharacterized protein YR821_p20061 [Yersinia ruckeri]